MRLGLARAGVPLLLLISSSSCGESSRGMGSGANMSTGGSGAGGGASPGAAGGGGAGGPSGSGGAGGTAAAAGSASVGAGGERPLAQGGVGGVAGATTGTGGMNVSAGGTATGGTAAGGAAVGGTHGAGESCSLVHHVEVPFPLHTVPAPFLVKSQSEFGLAAGMTLGALSWSGELARQVFDPQTCSNTTCDGLFGRTALRADGGWRLLSADRTGQQPSLRAWRMGDPNLPEAQPLSGPEFSGLVSSFDLKPSRDGKRALFANGHRVVTQQVMFVLVDADGRAVVPALPLDLPYKFWDALTVVPTEHAAAVSVFAESEDRTQRVWLLRELDSTGQLVFASQVTVPDGYACASGGAGACAIVEDAEAYYIWLTTNGGMPRIGRLRRDHPDELVIDETVVAPGPLVGELSGTLVFRLDEYKDPGVQARFLGLPKNGAAEAHTLVLTPAVDRNLNAPPQLIATEGNSIFYGYQTIDRQVIEEVVCPAVF